MKQVTGSSSCLSHPGLYESSPGSTAVLRLKAQPKGMAWGCPRDYLNNKLVYVVLSPRARGLSIGVNLNPDQRCNFDCVYCEVNRKNAPRDFVANVDTSSLIDLDLLSEELEQTLGLTLSGDVRALSHYRNFPESLLRPRHVALSGDGEPTLCPQFEEVVERIVHTRARGTRSFFKLVLVTNGTGLDRHEVRRGLRFFTSADEVWVKLDAGTQMHLDRVNRSSVPLGQILTNIVEYSRLRPIIIQSLFPSVAGLAPSLAEIGEYVLRLKELVEAGANISLVQIYSATRPTPHSVCGHLPLRTLSQIGTSVRNSTGLCVEVF